MTNEEVVDWKLSKIFVADNDGYSPGAFWEYVGLSASNESYEMPDYVKQWLISKGCKVWD
jgi:hypothetical protein